MKPDPSKQGHAEQHPEGRLCDYPDCCHVGGYRAPRSRTLEDYYWFCLDHVRDYNRAWNYCEGMTPEEIEEQIRLDTVWGRPTWRRSAQGMPRNFDADRLREDCGAFGRDWADSPPRSQQAGSREEDALRTLGLSPPLTLGGLKARYKELVKRFHPDTHGGDKATEEKLKTVIAAYKTLIGSLTPGYDP